MGIRIENLSLRLGKQQALDDITTHFPADTLSVIIGPNGAGKSSLLKVLAGLEPRHSGTLSIDGDNMAELSRRDRARRIAYLPQEPSVHWDITARDLVMLGRHPHRDPMRAPGQSDQEAVERALAMTDTTQFAARPVMSLSGGERMRVMIARLIAGEPEWILADEPLASLDPKHRIQVMALLQRLSQSGTGVIAVLHDLNEARRWAEHTLVMDGGRAVHAGEAIEILSPDILSPIFGAPMIGVMAPDGTRHLIVG